MIEERLDKIILLLQQLINKQSLIIKGIPTISLQDSNKNNKLVTMLGEKTVGSEGGIAYSPLQKEHYHTDSRPIRSQDSGIMHKDTEPENMERTHDAQHKQRTSIDETGGYLTHKKLDNQIEDVAVELKKAGYPVTISDKEIREKYPESFEDNMKSSIKEVNTILGHPIMYSSDEIMRKLMLNEPEEFE